MSSVRCISVFDILHTDISDIPDSSHFTEMTDSKVKICDNESVVCCVLKDEEFQGFIYHFHTKLDCTDQF